MAETEKKASKKSWFKGLKAEFRKIIWVDNKTLGKQTVAVVAISAVTCGLITLVDSAVIEFSIVFSILYLVKGCDNNPQNYC